MTTRSLTLMRMDRWASWAMGGLLLAVTSAIVAGWRYFPGFSGDHSWYLQVALRVSRGEILYREVAWAYGPLPAQALAALFRWLGPDGAWASLINAGLTITGVWLTYAVTRSVLKPAGAFLVTAFAVLVGPNLWGGLLHIYNYTYTQAIAWGAVLSLAALVCALRWQQTQRQFWIGLSGLATGLAILCKPEFGVTALGSVVAAIAVGRGRVTIWGRFLLVAGVTTGLGLGWQVWTAGWEPVWRGYLGYSQLTDRVGSLWGTYIGSRSLLFGGYAFWLAIAVVWACRRWPRRRLVVASIACLLGLALLVAGLLVLTGGLPQGLRQGTLNGAALMSRGWSYLSALPWAPVMPLLLLVGWLARRRAMAPAWWALWAYAVIANLRLFLTGYTSGLAVAPALAVFWVFVDHWFGDAPQDLRIARRLALAMFAGLTALGLVGQVVVPNDLFNGPRVWVDSAIGPLRVAQPYLERYESMAAFVDQAVPDSAPIFSGDYGAQWYLVTKHPNPTAFDVVIAGMGLSGPEASSLERALLAQPPAAVIVPELWQTEPDPVHSDALAMRRNLPAWWQRFGEDYTDATPPGVATWRVFLHD